MNKRLISLIAALLAVIMLIPSVAMAEGVFQIGGTKAFEVKLYGGLANVPLTGMTIANTTLKPEDEGYVEWISGNYGAVWVEPETDVNDDGTVPLPGVLAISPTAAAVTITGTLYRMNGTSPIKLGSDSFTVKAVEVPEKEIKLVSPLPTLEVVVGKTLNVKAAVQPQVLSGEETTDPTHTPTYGVDYLQWEVDDPTKANINKNGVIQGVAEGTVNVYAKAYYNKSVKSVAIPVKVVKAADPTTVELDIPITEITFTQKSYTIKVNSTFDPEMYLATSPDLYIDTIRWTSSDPAVLKLTTEDGHIFRALKASGDAGVTITGYSYMTGAKLGEATVIVKGGTAAPKPIKTLVISPTEDTLYLDTDWTGINIRSKYVTVLKPVKNDDHLIYSVDNADAAYVDAYGNLTLKKAADKVVITVSSFLDKSVSKTLTLTIKEKKPVAYKPIKFDPASIDVKMEDTFTVDAKNYLKPSSSKTTETAAGLRWIVDNPQIAQVSEGVVTVTPIDYTKDVTVKVTAISEVDSSISGSFTINWKAFSALDGAITKFTLLQKKFTFTTYDQVLPMNLNAYIAVDEPKDYADGFVFTSSDPSVVRVTEIGEVILHDCKPGTAQITVRPIKGQAEPQIITITHAKESQPVSFKFVNTPTVLKKTPGRMILWDYLKVDPFYFDQYELEDMLVWSSSNIQLATVDNGYVQFVAPSETEKVTITVATKDGSVKAECTFKTSDDPVKTMSFVQDSITLKAGSTYDLVPSGIIFNPEDADQAYKNTLRYTTSDPEIVDIYDFDDEEYPYLRAYKAGTATITAMVDNAYNQVYATLKVTVTDSSITGIKFQKSKYEVDFGNDDYVYAYFKLRPYDLNNASALRMVAADLDFQSSDRNILEIVDAGFDETNSLFWVEGKFVAPGTAKITVTSKATGVTGKTTVVGKAIEVKKIKLPKKSMKLFYYNQGETHDIMQNYYKLSYKIQPDNAWYKVTWETTNPGVAFIKDNLETDSESGVWIVATGAGTATITMNVDDGTTVRQAKMKVTVVSKTVDLKLNKKKATITMIKGKDNTLQLNAYDPVTEEPVNVKWKSSNKKVATVNKHGLVTAKKAGEATITATTKDGNETTATCVVTVEKKLVTSLKAKASISLKKKETKQLKIRVKPAKAYDPSLTFKSSDEKVVTVDSKGLVKAVGVGEATITVKTNDGSKLSLKIAVTVTK